MFGPLEGHVSNAYRGVFIDLSDFVQQIQRWGRADRILDLGCGEGALTQELARAFPTAHITGLDITSRVGRLYTGPTERVAFHQDTIARFAAENASQFGLVVVCDVLHHVPPPERAGFLTLATRALKPDGFLVLKEWTRSATLMHLLCFLSDRFVTGDRVRYHSARELRELLEGSLGNGSITAEALIKPRSNNLAFCIRPTGAVG
jgi:2-polyprenyl-6-hydroxyphenyl methylase/3-demethylubiquinone-9 3-methyltransferase